MLILAGLFKPNRNRQAWRIFLPLVIIYILLFLAGFVLRESELSFPQEAIYIAEYMVGLLAIGLCVLWLLSYKLMMREERNPLRLAMSISALMFIIGAFCFIGTNFNLETLSYLVAYGVVFVFFPLGIALAEYCSRIRSEIPLLFVFFLLIWLILLSIVGSLVFIVLESMVSLMVRADDININHFLIDLATDWSKIIRKAISIGSSAGALLFILILPFVILTFKSEFYLNRFNSIFRRNTIKRKQKEEIGEGEEKTVKW